MNNKGLRIFLILTLLIGFAYAQARAQAEIRKVPYRLTTESGEPIEMKLHYADNYSSVVGVDFDITVRKPDGVHQYRLQSAEGPFIVVELTVLDNKVTAATITADPAPGAGETLTLSVSSRSGEQLMFTIDAQGNSRITSDRMAK